MRGRELDCPSGRTSISCAIDPLLNAARDGWATTLRYALLLLVKRGTVGVIIWTVLELLSKGFVH
jgi:hypothetical protein